MRSVSTRHVLLAWGMGSLLASLPLYISGSLATRSGSTSPYETLSAATFEGVSALTSCGLTVSTRPDTLDPSIQLYRSGLEWIGGLGMVMIVGMAMRGQLRRDIQDQSGWSATHHDPAPITARRVVLVYTILTAAAALAFAAAGMPPWQALNHALTGISTGGFVITAEGFGNYSSAVKITAMVAMTVGALSMVLLASPPRSWLRRTSPERDTALVYLALLAAGGLMFVSLARPASWSALDTWFQWFSACTTTGFSATGPLEQLDPASTWTLAAVPGPVVILLTMMLIGGMRRSTAGGVKIDRVLRFAAAWKERMPAATLLIWTTSGIAGGILLNLSTPRDAWEATFEAVSALGTVGLSSGLATSESGLFTRAVLITLMIVGRLELVLSRADN
ncbi:MAG: TrkH family potassium uptake protein [Planctomycetota bacterium]|nr:MAG: TrkH family potassium uptake protein [Planctomycetota bacterium]